jgi:hypothetical protein
MQHPLSQANLDKYGVLNHHSISPDTEQLGIVRPPCRHQTGPAPIQK